MGSAYHLSQVNSYRILHILFFLAMGDALWMSRAEMKDSQLWLWMAEQDFGDEDMDIWCEWFTCFLEERRMRYERWNIVAQEVNFSKNRLTEVGILRLLEMFTELCLTVRTIKLFDNHIVDGLCIAEYILQCKGELLELHLSHNQLSLSQAFHIMAAVGLARKGDRWCYPTSHGKALWLRLDNNRIDYVMELIERFYHRMKIADRLEGSALLYYFHGKSPATLRHLPAIRMKNLMIQNEFPNQPASLHILRPRGVLSEIPALQIPIPKVGFGRTYWNIDRCPIGNRCEDRKCQYYHSEVEKRCCQYIHGICTHVPICRSYQGTCEYLCPHGLHIKMNDICDIFTVDLENIRNVKKKLQEREALPRYEEAKCVRFVIYGFAMICEKIIRKILDTMPLVHELVLPDRSMEPTLQVFLCDLVERCTHNNPRLRTVIFRDGRKMDLW